MQNTFTLNYLKIYFWQGVSIILNIFSLFIVIPKLTTMPVLYGIYSICISTTIFLIYADLGFMGATYKYASETVATNNLKEEIRLISFVGFVLFILVILFSGVLLIFSSNPQMLIRDLNNLQELAIASKLLFILAIFSPLIIFQRIFQVVFGIRLEDYIYQRLSILASLIRIASIFYFFSHSRYDIVGYFLFFQTVGVIFNLLFLSIIKKRYRYDFSLLIKSFRFSKDVFKKTKNLAFASLSITIIFVLYYEIDLFVIGKLLGAEMAGFYGVGLVSMGFFRGILGTIYGPFQARFNHFIGLNDSAGLKNLFYNVVILTMPLVVFPIISLILLMKPFIFSWVGNHYVLSVPVTQFLILSFIYNFITQPTSILLIAQEKIKWIYVINFLMLFIYWVGIFSTIHLFGIKAFAVFKFIAFTVAAFFYTFIAIKFLKLKLIVFLKKIFIPSLIPVSFLSLLLFYLRQFMPLTKSKINLITVVFVGGSISLATLFLYFLFSPDLKIYVKDKWVRIFKKDLSCVST